MPSKNVETFKASHKAFNNRDFDSWFDENPLADLAAENEHGVPP